MSRQLKRDPDESDSDFEVETEQLNLAADDPLRAYLPSNFGAQHVLQDANEIYEKARRVPLTPKKPKSNASDSDSDSDDSDDDDEFPTSHILTVKAHTKPVSSISLDPSGTRFATASHDYLLKLYDFHAMSRDHLHGFKSLEPSESHHIHSATFSPLDNGQRILVIPAAPQAKIYDRDGDEIVEFVKGDMYLRDMHNTKGHVAEITAGTWSPSDKNIFATASADSTIRVWDVNSKRQHKDIMVHKSKTGKGGRSRMCSLAWTGGAEGKSMLASVALDGALVVYPGNGPYTRPAMEVRNAHTPETWTGGLAFSPDGRLIVTRGLDECIKLWDTRKLKTPVSTRTAFPTPLHPEANLIFSPSSSNILTGDAAGNLHILSSATLSSEETHAIAPGHPLITLTWHPTLNQLLCGTSTGEVHMLFNPSISSKGAMTVLTNALRKRHIDDDISAITDAAAISGDAIMAPNEAAQRKRKLDERKPGMPAQTPWGKMAPDAEHIRKTHLLASMRDEDPREALLKYAEKAEKDPMFTGVWKKNQPEPVWAKPEDDIEEEDKAKKRRF